MIEKNRSEVLGFLFRRYPAFVLNDRVDTLRSIPAFVFHDVNAESLSPMLEFLAENHYATLTANEYVERQGRKVKGHQREVLLTFDDGHKSLFTVAYPALKRLGFKAVAYIVPGLTPEGKGSGGREIWGKSLCNWKEIGEMHESGTLDIQSHSMYHHSIPISDRAVDFVRQSIAFPLLEPYQALLTEEEGEIRKSYGYAYGTPLYNGSPRFSGVRAYRESPSVSLACVQYVDLHGGAHYFQQPNWRPRLNAVMAEARRKEASQDFETEEEQRKAILKDFVDSKWDIEQRLPGKIVKHFCFPWFKGSPLAVGLSAEAGYISNAWASLLPRFVQGVCSPIPIARLSPCYIWRLPGKGRKSIREIFQGRFSRIYRAGSIGLSLVG